jgi:hypothetical protein
MTSTKINRRAFITTGATVCGVCFCSPRASFSEDSAQEGATKKLDPKKLNYCGYSCPEDCKFLEATLTNNTELKKEAFKIWKIEDRFGIEFDPETAICYSCKTLDKPEGIVLQRCDVRACAQEKKMDCCIECDELGNCDKDLWRRFPKFQEQVVAMQVRFRAQQ